LNGEPLVSVIIPCWNAEAVVGEAIESALSQTYTNVEVIVIDDGSTDGSLDVIRSFGSRVRWETGPNRGACAARNRGLQLARGEFIQFLDSDDLLMAHKLARQVPASIRYPQEVVFCDWECEKLRGATGYLHCPRTTHSDSVILALRRVISTPAPLYPREGLKQIGGWREELPCAQDYDLNLRLACDGVRFRHLAEPLLIVRRVAGSVSSDYLRVLDCWEEIYWRAFRVLERAGTLTDDRCAAFATGFASHARTYLRHGLLEKAADRFRDAYAFHPSGGLPGAYGRSARLLRNLIGARATERFVQIKRNLVNADLPSPVEHR
jgi:glycosyltransferase involved in cell wall biosynthesis